MEFGLGAVSFTYPNGFMSNYLAMYVGGEAKVASLSMTNYITKHD